MRFIFLPLLFALAGCLPEKAPEIFRLSGETMGTTFNVTVVAPPVGATEDGLLSGINAVLTEVNGKMSNWDPASEVSLFNAEKSSDPVQISSEFAFVMAAANKVHAMSDSKFDVTLAPLINLWGFGPKIPGDPVPSDEEIATALQFVGQSDMLALTATTLQKASPEVTVNLSAIAKGYGVDRIAGYLHEEGIDRYLVEIGGDLVAHGLNDQDKAWTIGIERPDGSSGTVKQIVSLPDRGLATSGDYRNYFEQDGQRYSHIIDPTTGRPVTHKTASVTVVAEDAMMADALATAFFVVGQEAGMKIAETNDMAVFFIQRDGTDFVTSSSGAFQALIGNTD